MTQKRERSVNFSREEVDNLIKLVEENKVIIENKKSDAVTWGEKDRCWKAIELNFNSISGEIYRSAKTLRLKFESIKRDTRKKSALIRAETYQTGGGPSSAPVLTPSELKVKELILLSVDGMDSKFDSDHINTVVSLEQPKSPNTCSSSGLGTEDPETLVLNKQNLDDVIVNESEEIQFVNINLNTQETPVRPLKRSLCYLEENNKKWSQWKPDSLRSKKHPALSIPKQKKTFEKVAESKLEIIEIQKNMVEEEIINNRNKWSFEEKEREEQKKRWIFEEEERQHKREMWALEKALLLKKINVQ